MSDHWDAQAETFGEAMSAVWSETGTDYVQRAYACVDWITLRMKTWKLNKDLPVLDFGCGIGRLTLLMAELLPMLTFEGVDISPKMIAHAERSRKMAGLENVSFKVGSADEGGTIAGAYSMLVIQHLDRREARLNIESMVARTQPRGRVVFQFVEGAYHEGHDHRYTLDEIHYWASMHGGVVEAMDVDGDYPEWIWTTVVKR